MVTCVFSFSLPVLAFIFIAQRVSSPLTLLLIAIIALLLIVDFHRIFNFAKSRSRTYQGIYFPQREKGTQNMRIQQYVLVALFFQVFCEPDGIWTRPSNLFNGIVPCLVSYTYDIAFEVEPLRRPPGRPAIPQQCYKYKCENSSISDEYMYFGMIYWSIIRPIRTHSSSTACYLYLVQSPRVFLLKLSEVYTYYMIRLRVCVSYEHVVRTVLA